ncbi:hypothetical protein ACH79_15680 [Bradyrhizobium sp. CCBAU 051011]|uniref:tyrosine-type recombinase/integrase n=1 Tax=Bradyrhizobium sp. CCBAU 051011 TaxID=858422 RepID=UPI001373C826|nr:hypothetical protein ACH79_15680 [Bradyrhizobium sp. CCBAU 051011]
MSTITTQCSSHTLRFAAARRLAELGFSLKVVASINGHDSLEEVERYTKAAEQKLVAALGSHLPPGSKSLASPQFERKINQAHVPQHAAPRLIGTSMVPSFAHPSNAEGDTQRTLILRRGRTGGQGQASRSCDG